MTNYESAINLGYGALAGQNQGGAGMHPLVLASLIQGGAGFAGGLASLFGGKSEAEKRSEITFDMLRNRLGQNVFSSPDQYMAEYLRSAAGRWNPAAESIQRRVGLDSPIGAANLWKLMESDISGFRLNTMMENERLRAEHDMKLLQLMASLGG